LSLGSQPLRRAALTLLCLGFGPLIYVSARAATLGLLLLAVAALHAPESDAAAVLVRALRRLAILAPFFLWMLLSALWSFDALDAASLALRLAGLALAGAVLAGQFLDLPPAALRSPVLALAIGLTAAAAAVALDLPLGGEFGRSLHPPASDDFDPSLFYARAATLHAVFVIPLLVALIRLRAVRLAVLHTVAATLALFATASLSAKIALGLGLGVFVAVYALPRLRWAGLALLALATVALPALFPLTIGPQTSCWLIAHKPSALHRVMIWSFVAEHIDERPLAGWGLDASRRLPGGKEPLALKICAAEPRAGQVAMTSEILPLHPHNGILQVWLELGGLGALFGFGPFLLILARIFRLRRWRTRPTQAMFAGALASALSVSLVSFGIWQEWFLAGLFLAAGLAVLAARLTPAPEG
jgi:exopolysaccharide production protein ExoQ